MRVSDSFQITPRPIGRLGLGLRSGPYVVGRLGSKVWVGASFEIFALTAGGCPEWGGKLSAGKMSGGMITSEREMCYTRLRKYLARICNRWQCMLHFIISDIFLYCI